MGGKVGYAEAERKQNKHTPLYPSSSSSSSSSLRTKVILTLRAANNLANLWHKHVHGCHSAAIRVELHVEGLDFLRIVDENHRFLEDLLGNVALVLACKIAAPEDLLLEVAGLLLQWVGKGGGKGWVGGWAGRGGSEWVYESYRKTLA
jgi:hypothetical protein